MTSYLLCPNCDNRSRFQEVFGPDSEMHLICAKCGKPTDDAELAAAQPAEEPMSEYEELRAAGLSDHMINSLRNMGAAHDAMIYYVRSHRSTPKPETCTEAMERIERAAPCTRLDIAANCGGCGDITEMVMAWIAATFQHPERIRIDRIEVQV